MNYERVALITGASEGIGKAISLQLASEGIEQLVLVSRTASKLESVKQEIEAGSAAKAAIFAADLTKPADQAALVSFMEKHYGRLDYLVNNAGQFDQPTEELPTQQLAEIFNYDFTLMAAAPAALSLKLRPLLRAGQQQRILDVLSSAAIKYYPDNTSYGAAKAAHMDASLRTVFETNGAIRTVRLYPSNTNTKQVAHFDGPKMDSTDVARYGVQLLLGNDATDRCMRLFHDKIITASFRLDYDLYKREDSFDGHQLRQDHAARVQEFLLPVLERQ